MVQVLRLFPCISYILECSIAEARVAITGHIFISFFHFAICFRNSWCKCRKCGGKHLPAASKARFNAHFSGINAVDLVDFSMDLVSLLVLFSSVLLAGWYVSDSPYLYLYTLGAVAVGFVVREWSVERK